MRRCSPAGRRHRAAAPPAVRARGPCSPAAACFSSCEPTGRSSLDTSPPGTTAWPVIGQNACQSKANANSSLKKGQNVLKWQ